MGTAANDLEAAGDCRGRSNISAAAVGTAANDLEAAGELSETRVRATRSAAPDCRGRSIISLQ